MDTRTDLIDLAERVTADHDPLSVYIAVMDMGESYHLEVEVSGDTIGGIHDTGTLDLDYARELADALQEEFESRGVDVFVSREDWDNHLAEEIGGEDEDE